MKRFLERLKEQMTTGGPTNQMGGTFVDGEVGSAGNLAGPSAPLGFPTPITKHLRGGTGNPYVEKNKRQSPSPRPSLGGGGY